MNFSGNLQNRIETKNYCEVCGDKARGCNFDAITCASCKEFFRRNAFKQRGLKCYFQDNCTIDVISRRFCASCRLKKCFNAGMKREYIMSEEQRNARKVKINEKKQKIGSKKSDSNFVDKNSNSNSADSFTIADQLMDNSSMVTETQSSPSSPSTATNGIDSPGLPIGSFVNSDIFGYEEKPRFLQKRHSFGDIFMTNEINCSDVKSDDTSNEQNINSFPSDVKTIRKMLSKVKIIRESNYYPTKYALLCRQNEQRKELTPKEKHKLKHLVSNIQLMQAETIHALPCSGRFIDVLKITEIITFMLIRMCKNLTAFQELSQSDQIALVKGGCMETLILRSIMTLNLEKECWESMDLERNCKFSLKMEVLKQVNNFVYEAHRKYALSFAPEWRFDDSVMSLLIAISIFCPDRPNLTDVNKIRSEQQCYIDLLKRHLETIYDRSIAETTFQKLMNQLTFTKSISEEHIKAYFDVSTSQIEETGISRLLMEIFDLTPEMKS